MISKLSIFLLHTGFLKRFPDFHTPQGIFHDYSDFPSFFNPLPSKFKNLNIEKSREFLKHT